MRILLFHPFLAQIGGGARLVKEYVEHSSNKVDVYTTVYDKKIVGGLFKGIKVYPLIKKVPDWIHSPIKREINILVTLLHTKVNTKKYDAILVSVGSPAEVFALRNHIPGRTFMYCNSPFRPFASGYDSYRYMQRFSIPKWKFYITKTFYDFIEKLAWSKYDHVFFNSELTRERALNKNLIPKNKTSVIYPGVMK